MSTLAGDGMPLAESLLLYASGFEPRRVGPDELWQSCHDDATCDCWVSRQLGQSSEET